MTADNISYYFRDIFPLSHNQQIKLLNIISRYSIGYFISFYIDYSFNMSPRTAGCSEQTVALQIIS